MEHSTATAACDPAGEACDSAVPAGQVAYVADGPAAGAAWVGVLYESSEWSDFKLAQELAALDVPVRMIDMERVDAVEAALACRLLASRVFASALARGHAASHVRMAELIDRAGERGVVLINRGRAHAYEVSKRLATETLGREGIAVPAVYACAVPGAINPATLPYPCIIKPDCGGRSARTAMMRDAVEAQAFLAAAPSTTVFIVESFERARAGYLTRIEIVGGRVAHAHSMRIDAASPPTGSRPTTSAPRSSPIPTARIASAPPRSRLLHFWGSSWAALMSSRPRRRLCSSTPTPSRMSPLIARSFWATTLWRSMPPTSPGDIELFSANAEKRPSVSCSHSTPSVQRRCWSTSLIASSSVFIAGRSERKGYCR